MSRPTTLRASRSTIVLNKVKTFFSKPHNVILLLLGIVPGSDNTAYITGSVNDRITYTVFYCTLHTSGNGPDLILISVISDDNIFLNRTVPYRCLKG